MALNIYDIIDAKMAERQILKARWLEAEESIAILTKSLEDTQMEPTDRTQLRTQLREAEQKEDDAICAIAAHHDLIEALQDEAEREFEARMRAFDALLKERFRALEATYAAVRESVREWEAKKRQSAKSKPGEDAW